VTQTTTAAPRTGQGDRQVDRPDGARAQPVHVDVVPRGRLRRGLRGAFEGTPGELRLLALATVLACAAFAVLGGLAFESRRGALAGARADADQLVRVQEISTNLVRADAAATNAFLAQRTGPAPASLLQTYADAVSTASRRIADAARAQAGDAPALAQVNDALTIYTGRISAALTGERNNNTPTLATGYLGLASQTMLREAMLPALDKVVDADAARVDDAFAVADRAGWLLIGIGLVSVVVLVAVSVQVARRTHRYVNLPLTAATLGILLCVLVGGVVMASLQRQARDVQNTNYAAARALAEARIAAYRAKADESITLIRQNFNFVAGTFEDPGKTTIETAQSQLAVAKAAGFTGLTTDPLAAWTGVHTRVVDLVNRGQSAEAQQLATGNGPGTSNATFAGFESVTQQGLADEAARVDTGLTSSSWLLLTLALVALVVGLFAAVASWIGISQRLQEYR
jgi:hypothetical protein